MSRIFISHAAVDKPLVDAFVDLLITGLDVTRGQIFCSSLEGMHIRTGKPFVDYIKAQLTASDFVVMIITQPYFESAFCLCELGATWALGYENFPLLVPPMDFAHLKAVSANVQSRKIDDKDALNDLKDRLHEARSSNPNSARWESKRDTFLKALDPILSGLPKRSTVSTLEFQKLEQKYNATQDTVISHETTITELKTTIDKLAQAKDKVEVKTILDETKDEQEKFDELTEQFRSVVSDLPQIVIETMFKSVGGSDYVPDSGYGTDVLWGQIHKAKERGYLSFENSILSVDDSSPKIARANTILRDIDKFMSSVSSEFHEDFEEKHDFQFSLRVRDFWERHLGLR